MNEEYIEQIKNLCKACGLSIDKIAKQFNINQNLVAKLFMETMQTILSETEEEKPYDYRSVIYAIEHILLVYEKDISPNLHNKLSHWKKNIQEELDKE